MGLGVTWTGAIVSDSSYLFPYGGWDRGVGLDERLRDFEWTRSFSFVALPTDTSFPLSWSFWLVPKWLEKELLYLIHEVSKMNKIILFIPLQPLSLTKRVPLTSPLRKGKDLYLPHNIIIGLVLIPLFCLWRKSPRLWYKISFSVPL